MIDPQLLAILVCPASKAPLIMSRATGELWCAASGLAYPVRDGIPVMLEAEARELTDDECRSLTGGARETPAEQTENQPEDSR